MVESSESQAKKVCVRAAPCKREEEGVAVDLGPLQLGAKFKSEIGVLNEEEKEVVSFTCTCMYIVRVQLIYIY